MVTSRTKQLTRIAIFAALIAVSAFARLPNPLMPAVDITMQTAFVALAAFVLGGKNSFFAVCIYIALGLMGVPIFTRGGGVGYVLQPTFGFLLGMAASTLVIGFFQKRFAKLGTFGTFLAGLLGLATVYLVGLPYLYLVCRFYLGTILTAKTVFVSSFLLFLPTDLLTLFVAASVGKRLNRFTTL